MAKSLQDQLLKAGLANNKQAVKARKAKNSKEKLKRAGVAVVDEVEAQAKVVLDEQIARDKALNQQHVAIAEQKAIQAQIRQICSLNKIECRGEVEFSFTDGAMVKTLLLMEAERVALVRGALAIVKLDNVYSIVPRIAADKIAERDSAAVVLSNHQINATSGEPEDNYADEYADFKVPDDLMW